MTPYVLVSALTSAQIKEVGPQRVIGRTIQMFIHPYPPDCNVLYFPFAYSVAYLALSYVKAVQCLAPLFAFALIHS